MKVVVRHEPASEPDPSVANNLAVSRPAQTCVWVVGDDGETQGTEYLDEGQQVDLTVETTPAVTAAEFGEVGPIAVPPASS